MKKIIKIFTPLAIGTIVGLITSKGIKDYNMLISPPLAPPKILFPIAPEKITTKINGDNKTITLINQSEVNQIKGMKLTEISFDLLLPNQKYPFALYKDGIFHKAKYYLDKIEAFKKSKKPFKLKVIRIDGKNKTLFDTSMNVTLESYQIDEEADQGTDVKVSSIELKQYKTYGVATIKVKKKKSTTNKKVVTKEKLIKA